MTPDDLTRYLAVHPWHHETIERWPVQGELRLRLAFARDLPPPQVTSSILAIVINSRAQVLYLWPSQPSGSIAHLLIGGRPKFNEPPEATVIREVGEETGWRVEPGRMIGFRHFFHLGHRSEQSDRPYPDFVQPIYAALAVEFDKSLLVKEDQIEAEFIDFATAERKTDLAQRPLLYAAADDLKSRPQRP
jgi:ADP-ribose pyrophosphatase YjhB (NUDIX family)